MNFKKKIEKLHMGEKKGLHITLPKWYLVINYHEMCYKHTMADGLEHF